MYGLYPSMTLVESPAAAVFNLSMDTGALAGRCSAGLYGGNERINHHIVIGVSDNVA